MIKSLVRQLHQHTELLLILLLLPLGCVMSFVLVREFASDYSDRLIDQVSPALSSIISDEDHSSPLKLYFGGDIMLSRGIGYYNKQNQRTTMFSGTAYNPIHTHCQDDCLLFFNLESFFSKTPNDSPASTYHFAANTKNIDIIHRMKGKNFLYLSLANNHAQNVGKAGMMFTRDFLTQEQIAFGGVGEDNLTHGYNVFAYQTGDTKICVSSYSYDGGVFGRGQNQYYKEKLISGHVVRDAQIMDEWACDVKIASFHRGREYRMSPTPQQRELAQQAIDAGIDLIWGHHSHSPGFIEQYKGKYIMYSLGNHIFDQDWGMKTCSKNYDVIHDHQLERCTVPTYIGMNVLLTLDQQGDTTDIKLADVLFFGVRKGIQYPLDQQTISALKVELIKTE